MFVTRREALAAFGAGLMTSVGVPSLRGMASATELNLAPPISFAFSLYGMRSLPVGRALRICADIGYSGVELACMEAWPCDPALLTRQDRRDLRQQLTDLSLDLPCLMENLVAVVPEDKHQANLERLQKVIELARDLQGEQEMPPIVETVLGGRPEQWDELKAKMVASLMDWASVAAKSQVVLAIKAHASGALHRPADALWLLDQVRSPWLKLVYDYSHFERQGLPLRTTLREMLPETVFIHVKDNIMTPEGRTEFALPGDGSTNYREYMKLLVDMKFQGAVCVEVSGQVFGKPGYDPIIAAERSYLQLRGAFEQAGLRARI